MELIKYFIFIEYSTNKKGTMSSIYAVPSLNKI